MAYEVKPGDGSAFVNRDKKEDWHPDFKGKVMLPNGDEHWVGVRIRKTKAGDDWVSIKVGKKVEAMSPVYSGAHDQAKVNGYQPQRAGLADLDNDIPF